MKLELKHLAPYLPYGLKCHCMGEVKDDECTPIEFEVVGINDTAWVKVHEIGRTVTEEFIFSEVFPILRPLSDLTKEIEVNGQPVDASNMLGYAKFGSMFDDVGEEWEHYLNECTSNLLLTDFHGYEFYEKLFEYHFDVFGLIENGLAIDINKLNNTN